MTCVDLSRGRLSARGLFVRVFALLALVAISGNSFAGQVRLAWDAVANATGYRLYYGTSSGSYSSSIDATNQTTVTVSGLTDGVRYYFAVKAYNSTTTSNFSTEASAVVAAAPAANFAASPTTGVAPPTTTGSGGTTTTGSGSTTTTGSGSTTRIIAPHTKGLVAAYGFEELADSEVIDASGNANNGAVSGATRFATNFFGRTLKFDGVDDWVTVDDSASLDLTKAMTLEAWVYPTALSGWRIVIMKEGAGDEMYSLYANTADKNRPAVGITTTGLTAVYGTAQLPLNAWTHLAATYDGTTLRNYVNGILVATTPATGSLRISTGALRIGGDSIWGEFFQGMIDEVRVYNRALTQAEIVADSKTAVVGLLLSKSPDRSNALPLNGLAVSGTIYVYYTHINPTAASNPVKQVVFWLDDPNPTYPSGLPSRTEQKNPYDFAGTADSGGAIGFDTSGLSKGVHTITAQVMLSDGTVLPFINGTFTVQDAGQ